MSATNKPNGMTLIEIMISITLLAVGILGVIQAFPRGSSAVVDTALIATAEKLAQAEIETLIATDYASLPPGTLENRVHVTTDASNSLYDFLRTTTVALVDANLNDSATDIGMKRLTVTIYRPSALGAADRTTTVNYLYVKR